MVSSISNVVRLASGPRKAVALVTAALLASALLSFTGFGAAPAHADDPTATVNVSASANGGYVTDTIVNAYLVSNPGPDETLSFFTTADTGDGNLDGDGNPTVTGLASLTNLTPGADYVYEVLMPSSGDGGFTSDPDGTDANDYAITWFGSQAAYTPQDAGIAPAVDGSTLGVELLEGYSISGVASDPDSSTPGFQFAAAYEADPANPAGPLVQVTYGSGNDGNSDGEYTIGGLAPGQYKIQYTSTEPGIGYVWNGGVSTQAAASFIDLGEADITDENVQFGPGYSVAGTLDDPNGHPITDGSGWVVLSEADGTTWSGEGDLNPDGTFEIDNLPAGTYVLQSETSASNEFGEYYSGKGDAATATPITLSADNPVASVTPKLSAGFTATGRVTTSTGQAVPNVSVIANPGNSNFQGSSTVTTNSTGHYTFTGLAPGDYTYEVSDENASTFPDQYAGTSSDTVTAGDAAVLSFADGTQTLNIQLLPVSTLDVRLLSPSGTLVTGGQVEIRRIVGGKVDPEFDVAAYELPNKHGYYEAVGLDPSDTYTAFIDPGGSETLSPQYLGGSASADGAKLIHLTSGLNAIDATFTAPGSISGDVTDAVTGDPVGGVLVTLYSWDGAKWVVHDSEQEGTVNQGLLEDSVLSDSDGSYKFYDVQPGSYEVEFGTYPGDPETTDGRGPQQYLPQFSGGASSLATGTPVYVAGTGNQVQNAELVQGGVINGAVDSLPNATSAEVIPYYLGTDGLSAPVADFEQSAQTDVDGDYSIRGLATGVWELEYIVSPFSTNAYAGWVGTGDGSVGDATQFQVDADAGAIAAPDVTYGAPTLGAGSVVVTLTDSSGSAISAPWFNAELVPDGAANLSQDLNLAANFNDTSVATMTNVPVGGYTLIIQTQDYAQNYEYVPRAIPITVGSGENDITAQLSAVAPMNFTTPPTIDSSGGLAVGDTLAAVDGTVDAVGSTTTSYQWYRTPVAGDLTLIRGEQGSTYTLQSGDFGDQISVRVTHTAELDAAGQVLYSNSGSAMASAGPVVVASTNTGGGSITISGTGIVGQTVTADPGSWDVRGETFSYQWVEVGIGVPDTTITGATSSSYIVRPADIDTESGEIAVLVTAHRAGYPDSEAMESAPLTVQGSAGPVMLKAPTITSKTVAGVTTYTATTGTWSLKGTQFLFVWRVDGSDLATGPKFTAPPSGSVRLREDASVPGDGDNDGEYYVYVRKSTEAPTASPEPYVTDNTTSTAEPSSIVTGDSLSVTSGDWSYLDGISTPSGYRYQWNDVLGSKVTPIKGATSANYTVTAADVGKQVTVTVDADSAQYASGVYTASAAEAFLNPALTQPGDMGAITTPTDVALGATVRATLSGWTVPGIAQTYQWQWQNPLTSVWTNIAKATALSLVVNAPAVSGGAVRVLVSTTKAGYLSEPLVPSDPITVDKQLVALTAPTVTPATGVKVGATLTAKPGTANVAGAVASYQWSNDDGIVLGQTAASFKPTADDTDGPVFVTVIWKKTGYLDSVGSQSNGINVYAAPVAAPITTNAGVSLGTAAFGTAVQAPDPTAVFNFPGGFTAYSVGYQWKLAGKAISKATAATYTPIATDVSKALTVTETFSSTIYTAPATTSAASVIVLADAPTVSVQFTPAGAIRPGVVLTAVPGATTVTALTYTYQWQTSTDENTWTSIFGATKSTYTVAGVDTYNFLRVVIVAKKAGYVTATATSTDQVVTKVGNIDSIGAATLAAVPTVGVPLAATGVWDVKTGLVFSYQWILDGVDIPGATTATYVPLADEVTQGLSARITASEPGYVSATTTTNEVNIVLGAAPVMSTIAAHKAVITGSAATCGLLSVSPGLWNVSSLTVTYQWYRGANPIVGAVAATYQPVGASGSNGSDNASALHVVLTALSGTNLTGHYTTAATVAVAKCL